jgi:hypothetical protein
MGAVLSLFGETDTFLIVKAYCKPILSPCSGVVTRVTQASSNAKDSRLWVGFGVLATASDILGVFGNRVLCVSVPLYAVK